MNAEKENKKIEDTIKEKFDLLENILASETKIDLLEEVDGLNTKFYKALDNLKEARPVFANCDKAFTSVAEKLLRNFELVYSFLEAQYRGEVERRIAFLEAINDRIVPFYWETKWLHKPRQNYAATLIDMESDEVMKKVFSKKEREIFKKYLSKEPPQDPNRLEEGGEWEIVEESGAAESVQNAQESAPKAQGAAASASADKPAEDAKSASESVAEDKAEAPKKKRIRRNKERREEEENVRKGNQTG